MSMFSQASFRPLKDLPPQRPQSSSPNLSTVRTPDQPSHTSPFDEEDEFDLDDPHFHSHSRASSIPERLDQVGLARAGHTYARDHDAGELLGGLRGSPKDTSVLNNPTVQVPHPQQYSGLPRTSPAFPQPTHSTHSRESSRGHHLEPTEDMFSPPSPSGFGGARNARASPSPSRPHHLNALSPLQAFSPLQPLHHPQKESYAGPGSPETSSIKGHSRSNSLTRSLSRRQSLIANAAKWRGGVEDYENDDSLSSSGSFSLLTLVKAPQEASGLRRAKSSSALAPFSANSLDSNAPATTARGPRRSFAAASFAGFTPLSNPISLKSLPSPFSPHGQDAANRITQLHNGGDDTDTVQRKYLTPEEVFDVAQSISSPIVLPEGGFKGAELKRRKSAGASVRRGSGAHLSSPEKPPLALEPVEYVQLDDETLLPFVDRPAEVADLINHQSNEKMFKMLKAAFPKTPLREHWMALSPKEWNWDELIRHLTTLSRVECPDYAWIFRARQAIRARSIALWEKVGVCLGCDADLLNAGSEDNSPQSWGGLGLDQEGEYDPSQNQVWIEGLEAVDPDEKERNERQFREEFGEIVEDEGEQASAGMTALLGTIGEGEEESITPRSRQTTAQAAAQQRSNPTYDPLSSPNVPTSSLPKRDDPSRSPGRINKKARSKSFVGLQIMTSPQPRHGSLTRSPSSLTPGSIPASLPVFDRGPGSPLFPSSFSSLSYEPNLGRSASLAMGGAKAAPSQFGRSPARSSWITRKPSGAGLSESAITFASESDYSYPEIHA